MAALLIPAQRPDISRHRSTTTDQRPRSQAWIDTLRHPEGTRHSGGLRVRVPSLPRKSPGRWMFIAAESLPSATSCSQAGSQADVHCTNSGPKGVFALRAVGAAGRDRVRRTTELSQ